MLSRTHFLQASFNKCESHLRAPGEDSQLRLAPEKGQSLIFDWDGTLLDSFASGYAAFEKVFLHFDIPFDQARFFEHYSPNWYRFYERMELPPECWEEADRLWRAFYDQSRPALVCGARDVLHELYHRRYRLAVVTSGHQPRVERELHATGIHHYFQAFVYGDQVKEKKPAPEPLLRATMLLRTPTDRCVYIGDAPEDMEMGKRAGAVTVAVCSPYVRDFVALSAQADYTLKDISELLELLAKPSPPINPGVGRGY